MLCQELLCGCIELEAVFWFDKSVTLIGEEHIFVFDALFLHRLNNLFRFGLFHTGIVRPLSNQDRDPYLIDLEERRAGFQELLLRVRIAHSFV